VGPNTSAIFLILTNHDLQTRSSVGGYAFLTRNIILILVRWDDWFDDETLKDFGPLSLEVCDVYNTSSPQVSLGLPIRYTPVNIAMTASGFPSHPLQLSSGSLVDLLVADDTAERIVDLHFPGHKLYISTQRILRLYHCALHNDIRPVPPTVGDNWFLSWETWSPDVTFWLPLTGLRATLMPSYDGRACFTINGSEVDEDSIDVMEKLGIDSNLELDEELIVVLDFNRRPISRVASTDTQPKEWHWYPEDSVYHPIVSRLPFRIFQKKVRALFEALYIGHLRLITHVSPSPFMQSWD
jgi:hypothetical protein